MEAARTSETLVNFYQTTRRCNPEDSHLHTNRRENLKSYEEETDSIRNEFVVFCDEAVAYLLFNTGGCF
jgi:hypothetical protein